VYLPIRPVCSTVAVGSKSGRDMLLGLEPAGRQFLGFGRKARRDESGRKGTLQRAD
jgi:hypothetical protein